KIIIGPFKQLLTMNKLPVKGALSDDELEIIAAGGILIEGEKIVEVGDFSSLKEKWSDAAEVITLTDDYIALPGYVDCHTHIGFGGDRANDCAMRNAGSSYLKIAEAGGGIWNTVRDTRGLSEEELAQVTSLRADELLKQGITTIEVKSGYGLSVDEELKT